MAKAFVASVTKLEGNVTIFVTEIDKKTNTLKRVEKEVPAGYLVSLPNGTSVQLFERDMDFLGLPKKTGRYFSDASETGSDLYPEATIEGDSEDD